jgi:sporulation protein YlmC with PRC-barrel domain
MWNGAWTSFVWDQTKLKETSMKTTFATLAVTVMLLAGTTAMAADNPTPGAAEKNPAAQVLMTNVPGSALPISQFYNEDVYDAKDAKIGDIKDILVEKNGQVAAVILSVGGFLGIGEKDVAVPFNAIHLTEKDGKRYLVIDTTKEALQSAPGYTYDRTKGVWVPASKA